MEEGRKGEGKRDGEREQGAEGEREGGREEEIQISRAIYSSQLSRRY